MATKWWSNDTIAVITGSHRGIGLEIAKQLAHRGLTTVITSKDQSGLQKASDSLKQLGLHVIPHILDIRDPSSVQQFASWLYQEFGGLHILINNAGVSGSTVDSTSKAEITREILQTNYYGTKQITKAMIPLFKPLEQGSRIVMVSSASCRLDWLQGEASKWVPKLSDIENISEEIIDTFVENYEADAKEGMVVENGWPILSDDAEDPEVFTDYVVSKMGLSTYARLLARDLCSKRDEGSKIYVNCMCPGFAATYMTRDVGHPVEIGADTAVWLALQLPSENGKFFVRRKDVGFMHTPLFLNNRWAWSVEECIDMLLYP